LYPNLPTMEMVNQSITAVSRSMLLKKSASLGHARKTNVILSPAWNRDPIVGLTAPIVNPIASPIVGPIVTFDFATIQILSLAASLLILLYCFLESTPPLYNGTRMYRRNRACTSTSLHYVNCVQYWYQTSHRSVTSIP
jgi:hypothetical protein